MALNVSANAKINLHLEVGPRRKDGYHALRTLFQEISLHDTLTFSPSPREIQLTVDLPSLPCGPENIVFKAAALLKKKMKIAQGLQIHLEKKIPMGAGLGGGSSDAAATLKAAWTLWKNPSAKKLATFHRIPPVLLDCARRLGADVPFFLKGGQAWASGIGDILKPEKKGPTRWLILVYPRVHVSTPAAYGFLDADRKKRIKVEMKNEFPFNSFEAGILARFPIIDLVKKTLIELGCTSVLMSGSGSSVYGFVKNPAEGASILNRLQSRPWDVFMVQTISH